MLAPSPMIAACLARELVPVETILARPLSSPLSTDGNGGALTSFQLRRVVLFIEQNLDADLSLSRLAAKPAGTLKVIEQLPEATLLRLEMADGRREVYSLLRNRAHSNVAFMLGEELRYQPALDTLTVYPGVLSSYPNFIFNVPVEQVAAFVTALEQARDAAALEKVVERWGIRRTHPEFWRYFHDMSAYIQQTEPLEAGVLDMNRYENL